MPIYEYSCSECGHEFELMQKITDGPRRKCPACGRLKARRTVSQTSFVLKGGGWYVTEYGGRKAGKEEKAPADAPAAKESTSPEPAAAKPEKAKAKTAGA